MRALFYFVAVTTMSLFSLGQSQAVELLISGDFETPGGVGDIPGWILDEFATGSDAPINSADLTGGEDVRLFLRAFAGGGPAGPDLGNFNGVGGVEGQDYLRLQQNFGLTGTALPEDGDANNDMNVDDQDLTIWSDNYGAGNSQLINARLTQRVPASPGETYNFVGTSTFETNYSGFVTTLDPESPFGAIPSPTQTLFRMEFLDAGGSVLGSHELDLKTEQTFPGFPIIHSPVTGTAPAGTTDVRVTAEALDMAWNGNAGTGGNDQSAFFNDFSLSTASNPSTELLTNGDLNLGPPDALDFWDQSIDPDDCCGASETDPFGQVLRTPIAAWANDTPGGSRGVWFSAFWGGSNNNFDPRPIDGVLSQTVEAVPGATYTFSGKSKFEGNYSGGVDTIANDAEAVFAGQPSPTETEILLEFLDIDKNVIETFTIDVKADRVTQLGCSGTEGCANSNTWLQHSLEAVAPAGTEFARLTGQFIDGVYNTQPQQSAFFDDFSLDGPAVGAIATLNAVPEPASLTFLGFGVMLWSTRRRRA